MVEADSPVMYATNDPSPDPALYFELLVVGLIDTPQQIPFSEMVPPPSVTFSPPPVADDCPIFDIDEVVMEASFGSVVKYSLAP